MRLEEKLTTILKHYFDHDVVYVSHERRSEAKQAIVEAIMEIVPIPDGEGDDFSDGWNACRDAMLEKLP